jgi:hypothetical protein
MRNQVLAGLLLGLGVLLGGGRPAVADHAMHHVEGQLVADFPAMPVYPGAVLEDSYKKEDAGKVGYEASWVTTARFADVANWYVRALRDAGWLILEAPPLKMAPDDIDVATAIKVQRNEITATLFIEQEVEEGEGLHTEIDVEIPLHVPSGVLQ